MACAWVCVHVAKDTEAGRGEVVVGHMDVPGGKWLLSVFRKGNRLLARSSQQLSGLPALYPSLCPFPLFPPTHPLSPLARLQPIPPLLFFVSPPDGQMGGRKARRRRRRKRGGGNRMQIGEGHWGQIWVSHCQNADKDTRILAHTHSTTTVQTLGEV